jgi:hypothetical protein
LLSSAMVFFVADGCIVALLSTPFFFIMLNETYLFDLITVAL